MTHYKIDQLFAFPKGINQTVHRCPFVFMKQIGRGGGKLIVLSYSSLWSTWALELHRLPRLSFYLVIGIPSVLPKLNSHDSKCFLIHQRRPLLLFIFGLFKQTSSQYFTTNTCEKMSIQYTVPGFKPRTFITWVSSNNYLTSAPTLWFKMFVKQWWNHLLVLHFDRPIYTN